MRILVPRGVAALAVLLALACAGAPAWAQLAARPLLPQGNLFLDVGNASPLEAAGRGYVAGVIQDGEFTFRDGDRVDLSGLLVAGGVDIPLGSLVVSGGGSVQSSVATATDSGIEVEDELSVLNLTGRVSWVSESVVFGAEVERKSLSETITASSVSLSASGSAEVEFFDVRLGGSVVLADLLVLGVAYSPAVSDQGSFDGALSGFVRRAGHGETVILGLGLVSERFSAAVQIANEEQETDAGAAAESLIGATGEVLVGESLSIAAAISMSESDPFVEQGQTIAEGRDETALGVELRKRLGQLVVGAFLIQESTEGRHTGVPAVDADRLEQSDSIEVGVTAVITF